MVGLEGGSDEREGVHREGGSGYSPQGRVHARYVTFPIAEVAVPKALFEQLLTTISRLTPLYDTG